jgi:hypothetical protein
MRSYRSLQRRLAAAEGAATKLEEAEERKRLSAIERKVSPEEAEGAYRRVVEVARSTPPSPEWKELDAHEALERYLAFIREA